MTYTVHKKKICTYITIDLNRVLCYCPFTVKLSHFIVSSAYIFFYFIFVFFTFV